MDTRIATDLAVDSPLEMDDTYRFDHEDRRYIDDQIRAIEQLIVDNLISGKHASWFSLSGASDAVAAGDTVCLASSQGLVTKSTADDLSNSSAALGVVLQAASPGSNVLVAFGGLVPPSITGLGAITGLVAVNPTTGRCQRADSVTNGDYPIGTVDAAGWMQVMPAPVVGGGADVTITGTVTYQGDHMRVISIPGELFTTDTDPDVIAQFEMLDETTCRFDFTASMKARGVTAHAGSWDGKVTYYRTAGGAPQIVGAAEYGTAFTTDAGDTVLFDVDVNTIQVIATSADDDNRNWDCELRVQETDSLGSGG